MNFNIDAYMVVQGFRRDEVVVKLYLCLDAVVSNRVSI
jgi:hypothetical protein